MPCKIKTRFENNWLNFVTKTFWVLSNFCFVWVKTTKPKPTTKTIKPKTIKSKLQLSKEKRCMGELIQCYSFWLVIKVILIYILSLVTSLTYIYQLNERIHLLITNLLKFVTYNYGTKLYSLWEATFNYLALNYFDHIFTLSANTFFQSLYARMSEVKVRVDVHIFIRMK